MVKWQLPIPGKSNMIYNAYFWLWTFLTIISCSNFDFDSSGTSQPRNTNSFGSAILDVPVGPVFNYAATNIKFAHYFKNRAVNIEACKDLELKDPTQYNKYKSEQNYSPLVIEDYETEDQMNPSKSVIARIMARYRRNADCDSFINWDNLDLTNFENQHFPVTEMFTKSKTPDLTTRALNLLTQYETYIQFHNPSTIEGKRMLLFQKLYKKYQKMLGKRAKPCYIDWDHCAVDNWPECVDRSDLSQWTEEQVLNLTALLESGKLLFKSSIKLLQNQPKPLGRTDRPIVKVQLKRTSGDGCALSEDEKICGGPIPIIGGSKTHKRKRTRNVEINEPINTRKRSKLTTSNSVDDRKRSFLLKKVLGKYRMQTGQPEVEIIDWSLVNLSKFRNHLLPFNPNLRTEFDLLKLSKLLKSNTLNFLQLTKVSDRASRLFVRLYAKCGEDIGNNLNEFNILWDQMDMAGWPDGVNHNYCRWSNKDVSEIEGRLDAGLIRFKLKENESVNDSLLSASSDANSSSLSASSDTNDDSLCVSSDTNDSSLYSFNTNDTSMYISSPESLSVRTMIPAEDGLSEEKIPVTASTSKIPEIGIETRGLKRKRIEMNNGNATVVVTRSSKVKRRCRGIQ